MALGRSTLKRRRGVSEATPAQRARCDDQTCIVCGSWHVEPAHVVDRSLAPSWGDHTEIVVPLCRHHHDVYDAHELDLSPFIEPHWRDAAAAAVQAVGLFAALRRITGEDWTVAA